MRRIAMIKDGVVQNIALWNGETPWKPEGFIFFDVTDYPEIGPGFTYVNGVFSEPVEE